MYNEYFGFSIAPFNNTPDPRFFFNSQDHEEALASLIYCATERKGFVLVTGEIGSGKTLLSRLLISRLPAGTRSAVISNTRLTGVELLRAICCEFSLDVGSLSTAAELGRALEKFLLEQYARDRIAVLILDEAQNLPLEAFEEVRMLGNLEADNAKLLQVLILGQPELQDSFRQPELRQLHQRVCRTFHLREFTLKQTSQYVEHRLTVAGHEAPASIFVNGAYEQIFHHSEGIPRLINQICDNSLLAAYTDSVKQITPNLIDEVVSQMMSLTEPVKKPQARKAAGGAEPVEPPHSPRTDAVLRELMDRLSASERKIKDVEEISRNASSPVSVAEREATFAQIKSIRAMQDRAAGIIQEAERGAIELRDNLVRMSAETRIASEQAARDVTAALAENRKNAETLRTEIMRLWEGVREDSERQRKHVDDILRQDREQFAHAQRQIDEISAVLRARSTDVRDRTAQLEDFVKVQTEATTRRLTDLEAQSSSKAARMAEALDAFVKESYDRFENAHVRMVDLTSTAETDLRKARETLLTARDRIVAEADADRRSAAALLTETQDLLSRTREQTSSFLAGFESRVVETVKRSEQTCHQAVAEGEQAMAEMRTRIAETRAQAERSRESLESLIANAAAQFSEARSSLNGDFAAHVVEINRARDDMAGVRADLTRQISAMRDDLTDASDAHRRQMIDFRQESAALIQEAGSSLAAASARAKRSAEEIQLDLNQALANLQIQSKELRSQADLQLEALRDCIGDSVSKGQGRLDQLRQKINDLTREAAAGISELQARVDSLRSDVRGTLDISEVRVREQAAEAENRVAEAMGRCRTTIQELAAMQNTVGAEMRILRDELSGREESARTVAIRLADELAAASGRATRVIDDLQIRVTETLELATTRVSQVGTGAEQIYSRLVESVEALERRSTECRVMTDEQSARMQREMSEVVERNRKSIEETEGQVETLVRQATASADEFSRKLQLIRQSSQNSLATAGQQIRDCLINATKEADRLKSEAEAATRELAKRTEEAAARTQSAVDQAEGLVETIAEHSRNSLAEVRAGLTQMTDRSATLQRDFSRIGAELRETATSAIEQLRTTAGGVTAQIEALRDGAQRDADAHQRKMTTLRQQVEASAEQIRGSAARLLDQVQAGAANIREHANELLKQAQGGATAMSEQATRLLAQAQESADRFREQAEAILQRSESAAESVKTDLVRLRGEVMEDVDRVKDQVLATKRELGESRQESTEALRQATQAHRTAQSESQALLKRADDVQEQTIQLMHMPRELVGEARKNAQLLKDMSAKIALIIRQLSDANGKAQTSKLEVAEATASADQRLVDLRKHTEQVAKLVTIIRQLYGAMDSRIDRLRDRLTSADEIVKSVPREIASLKAALNPEAMHPQFALPASPMAFRSDGSPNVPRRAPASPAASQAAASAARKLAPVGKGTQADSLAAVVQKNKKLNEWLQKTLVEEAQASASGGVNRTAGVPPTPRPIPEAANATTPAGMQPPSAA